MDEATPGEISVSLGRCIKRCRLSQRLRLVDVSRRADLSVPTVRAIERGDASVAFGNYAFVAVMLGAGDLFDRIIQESAVIESDPRQQARVRVAKSKAYP